MNYKKNESKDIKLDRKKSYGPSAALLEDLALVEFATSFIGSSP